jgi:E3 ubiquitin-protein ligase SHPRH
MMRLIKKQWLAAHKKCPMCTTSLDLSGCTRISLRNLEKQPATETLASSSTAQLTSPLVQPLPSEIASLPIEGGYGSKIDSIVRHLRYIRLTTPGAKALIFSQWTQLLEIIGMALTKNGIRFVKFEKRKNEAVVNFKNDPDSMVFMLHATSQSRYIVPAFLWHAPSLTLFF